MHIYIFFVQRKLGTELEPPTWCNLFHTVLKYCAALTQTQVVIGGQVNAKR